MGGGGEALYRTNRDIELVARLGRWRDASINVYLWEGDQAMAGISSLMAIVGHTLHLPTKGMRQKVLKTLLRPDTPCGNTGTKGETPRKRRPQSQNFRNRRDCNRWLGESKISRGLSIIK